MLEHLSRAARLFGRACRVRCPNCGGGAIFDSWFRMKTACPTCGLAFDRGEEGYQVGSYMFNIILAELVFAVVLIVILARSWPSPPWDVLEYAAPALMVVLPFALFPLTKTLYLALDLLLRPGS
ncbi:MAG TPA: DUF983 domain-containing protein [Gemmatimonadales bacterium]|jgi:uncharacterized protein (DUF983 family)|nr:DUF983 domain-containing protein [Gemmatimonadales bacterium]